MIPQSEFLQVRYLFFISLLLLYINSCSLNDVRLQIKTNNVCMG